VELGLYHPRCKDSHKTYFPEISTLPDDKIGEYVATHEFVHSMIDRESPLKNYIGMDTKQFTKIRKEIKGIYNEYMDEISTMKLSRYSMENADEFMAEAFAQVKIGSEKGKYSDRVMEVLDKHFGKSVANPVDSDIIKLADINKMPTEYEQKVLDSVPDKEGYFTLAAHGNSQSIQYGESEKTLSKESGKYYSSQ
jgi:hypothetical protein